MSDKRILIIAQTPPPFHGQSIMQKHLVDANWKWCKKDFVRMNFSNEINEVGVFRIKKLWQLISLIDRVRKKRISNVDLIYYPPGGPNRIPIYRDIILLSFLKLFSKKIILHFHAGGINNIFKKVTKFESYFIKKAFAKADGAVVLTDWLKQEIEWCDPKKIFVVGNGIEDVFHKFQKTRTNKNTTFLFVGNLKKEKGIFTLLEAAVVLKNLGENFKINFIGSFHYEFEQKNFFDFVEQNKLNDCICYLGTKNGDDKWREFEKADVFCLPTYETEAMPISIIEAMMFEMPVITTRWRSIPDLIKHEENGLLFEPDNASQLASCMQKLIHAENERRIMGQKGRAKYIQNFTVDVHLKKMEKSFMELLTN